MVFRGHLSAFARQSFSGIWLTGLRVAAAGQDVVLEGRAVRPELVPNYLQRLNQEDVMQGHAFAELEIRRPEAADKAQGQARFVEFRLATLPESDTTSSCGRAMKQSWRRLEQRFGLLTRRERGILLGGGLAVILILGYSYHRCLDCPATGAWRSTRGGARGCPDVERRSRNR